MHWMTSRLIIVGLLAAAIRVSAAEHLPVLKVGSEVYSNVTVTSVTATDIFFSHARGLGNAKLKNLEPEQQTHFHFDAAKGGEAEKQQAAAHLKYRQELAAAQPPPLAQEKIEVPPVKEVDGDPVVAELHAKSFRGQRPPPLIVDQWLTPLPDGKGKFVLVDFWATWCGPCRKSIPHLNELQAKFKDKLVVIGLSDETEEAVRKMTAPKINYCVGTDTQGRTLKAVEVKGIPHAMLMDPKGIVRYEGSPFYLEEKALEKLIAKYSK